MRVLIVGGGIGGLTLALSLHAAGIDDIELFEAAPVVAELGVGINVLPHAVRELTELGLGDGRHRAPPLDRRRHSGRRSSRSRMMYRCSRVNVMMMRNRMNEMAAPEP